MSLREKILAAQEMPTETVPTPEWAPPPVGVPSVVVRGLSAAEREEWERWVGSTEDPKKNTFVREKLVAMTVVEEIDGKLQPVFSRKDVEELSHTSSGAIVRLWDVARRLSGMQTEAEAQAQGNPSSGDQDEPDSPDSP